MGTMSESGGNLNVLITITGVHFVSKGTETFTYSNNGVMYNGGNSNDPSVYYEPLLSGGVLTRLEAKTNTTDKVSINLVADNALTDLSEYYLFDGQDIKVEVSREGSDAIYPLFTGKIDSYLIQNKRIRVNASSMYALLDEEINPNTWDGSGTAPRTLSGEEELEGIIKPRIFGNVFNITPFLIYSSQQIYAFNYDHDGNTAPVQEVVNVRDGGNPLIFDQDFTTYNGLLGYNPQIGSYATCIAEGLIRLRVEPVKGLTLDVKEQSDNYYATITNVILPEVGLTLASGFSLNSNKYGIYVTDTMTYTQLDSIYKTDMDAYSYVDGGSKFTVGVIDLDSVQPPVANFIEVGTSFGDSAKDIQVLSVERMNYNTPPPSLKMGYAKNYTVQGESDLATNLEIGDGKRTLYGAEYSYIDLANDCNPNFYAGQTKVEFDTYISNSTDANSHATSWLEPRKSIIDTLEVRCVLFTSNDNKTTGGSGKDPLIDGKVPLNMGDVVKVNAYNLKVIDNQYIITGVYSNTKTKTITYQVQGVKTLTSCS